MIPIKKYSYQPQFSGSGEQSNPLSLPQIRLDSTRADILNYFQNTWQLTELLFSGLANEDAFYSRAPHQLRHPMIFYYVHPAVLYINKLRVAGLIDKTIDAELETLFETGVDEMRWDNLHEGDPNIWPSLEKVRQYRKHVYKLIYTLIETHPSLEYAHMPITQQSPLWALVMGFEHERIHLETSSVLMRELPIEHLKYPKNWPASHHKAKTSLTPTLGKNYPANELMAVAETTVTLGKPYDYLTFGWDNEYGSEEHAVHPFSASNFLVSNGEFHNFVSDGGYTAKQYWSENGWAWRSFRNTKWPSFWSPKGPSGLHHYSLRIIFEIIDMQWDWPVNVNFHEAQAYCKWLTEKEGSPLPYRLITETEHNAIRDNSVRIYNLDLSQASESAVNAMPANSNGFHDVFGNVWQWCEDFFRPLDGFKPHPFYDDFSIPCFDNQHHMLLGGSFISTGDEASKWARFHFRPHFFQHAGFRIVRSNVSAADNFHAPTLNTYETQSMLDKYMLMHWGNENEIFDKQLASNITFPKVVHLPLKCAELIKKYSTAFDNALDLGCAVGRSTFEMARDFKTVLGIDYSHEFIRAANALQHTGRFDYISKISGAEAEQLQAVADPKIDRNRLSFAQGDACKLPKELKNYDAVLLANVLCRLPDPAQCLKRMQGTKGLIKPGGILVMTTPFSWLPEYTSQANWIDGIDGVKSILTEFELLHQEELPFMIREHQRKFEYIITLASIWRRKVN
jgi:5-histidylcysteine sulfoxide synthase/putative 4-mercaptohistidine N1-methyltranferase